MKKSGKKPHIITWYFELDTEADFGLFVCYNERVKQHRKHSSLKIQVLYSTAYKVLNWKQDVTTAPGFVHGSCFVFF